MEQKVGQVNLAGRELARASRPHPAVHLPVRFARRERHRLFPLAAAAHRQREILRRRPAASSRRQQPRLPGNQPDRRGIKNARARAQGHKSRLRSLHPLQPRQRLGVAAAQPAEQIFQPARTHPAHLQRASRPQHPRGFRAARPRICRNTKSFSRRRCMCFPPAKPTA